MNLSEYQQKARSTGIYIKKPNTKIIYPILGLIGECGEVSEKIKKLIRDDDGKLTLDRIAAIEKELGDCCWYVANICCDLGLELHTIYEMRGFAITQQVQNLSLPQLVIKMHRHAAIVAESLGSLYYKHGCDTTAINIFPEIPNSLSNIVSCIEEIARQCDLTLENICITNIVKLKSRQQRGTLHGEGDDR